MPSVNLLKGGTRIKSGYDGKEGDRLSWRSWGGAGNAPYERGICLILRKIGTSIGSRTYSHQNSSAIATREAAELGA
jgi:hypothetical protein